MFALTSPELVLKYTLENRTVKLCKVSLQIYLDDLCRKLITHELTSSYFAQYNYHISLKSE